MSKEVWKPIPATAKGLTFEDIGVDRKVFEEPVAPAGDFSILEPELTLITALKSYAKSFYMCGILFLDNDIRFTVFQDNRKRTGSPPQDIKVIVSRSLHSPDRIEKYHWTNFSPGTWYSGSMMSAPVRKKLEALLLTV